MQGPKWPFLLRYVSRVTSRIDFSQVYGYSTDPRDLGCHKKRAGIGIWRPLAIRS